MFAELKKKYNDVVYKRRIALPNREAIIWLAGEKHCTQHTQIVKEIDYAVQLYGTLHPTIFLMSERHTIAMIGLIFA